MKILYRYTEIIIGSLYPMEMCLFRHGGTTEVQVRDSLKGGKCISVVFPGKIQAVLEIIGIWKKHNLNFMKKL